jgi:hypothetical protein
MIIDYFTPKMVSGDGHGA